MNLISRIPFCVLLYFSLAIDNAGSENILFVIGALASYSHRVGLEPLANALADRGHNVTFLSPLKSYKNHPKITEYCPEGIKTLNDIVHKEYGVIGLKSRLSSQGGADLLQDNGETLFKIGYGACQGMLESPGFKSWVDRSTFDLVVLDKSSMMDCAFALAWKFGAKTVSYDAVPLVMAWDYFIFGVPVETWWFVTPDVFFQGTEPGFKERVWAMYKLLMWWYGYSQFYLPALETLFREAKDIGFEGMPSLRELIWKDGVELINFHASDHFVKSLPPTLIPIGGMHLEESNGTLPKEIESFVQKGKDGFIYISFGSIVKISSVPPEFVRVFLDAMEALPNYRFLWKWEGELPGDIPDNALLKAWFPQNDVLAHPKIRTFITQGGQISLQQAIFHGVPMVLLPVNGDQDYNAKRLRRAGNGIEVELFGLTSEILRDSILEVLEKPSYKKVAEKLKKITRDRPMSAVETGVWWTEYVLRHEDTDYLKPFVKPWWMIVPFDIIGFIVTVALLGLLLILLISYYLFRFLASLTSGNSKNSDSKKFK